ncbi:MAG: hypothetical protein QXI33_03545 [Candidatus Pacearchaeota archaeon]
MRLYRKGLPRSGCCWFTEYEEALNWDGNDEKIISRIILLEEEFNTFFEQNGVGYKLSHEGFRYFERRIEMYYIDDFLDRCNDPVIGKFM